MKRPWSWWVYYRELDPQGGYWPVGPTGPFDTLGAARWAKYKIEHPISPFSGHRHADVSDRVRDVHIRLRLEVPLSQHVQFLNTPPRKKENHHAV